MRGKDENMTVKQLIAKLKKMPQTAKVAWQAHDQAEDEIDGIIEDVAEASDFLKKEHGVGVVLR
ncbi:MAG: hypothetical protein NUV42_02980 [Candidatus Yonathbacteria bacterium]|nr:hypothetical protein [Candidatus Yonathbacteria bacterium]